MKAIDNSALLNIDKAPVTTAGFAPTLTFAYDADAKTVTVTDDSDFPAGDSFSKVNVKIHDEDGGMINGVITAAAGNTAAKDVSGLDLAKDLTITATVVSTKGCISTGSARRINATNAAGSLTNWTTGEFTTATGL